MKIWRIWIIAGLLIAAGAGLILAKGPPARVTIDGPGLRAPIEVVGDEALETLGLVELMDVSARVTAPADPGSGYTMVRFYQRSDGAYLPFDSLVYHPGADGGVAYVNYIGIINGSSEYDGRWFPATAAGDAAMRAILRDNGILLESPGSARTNPVGSLASLIAFLRRFEASPFLNPLTE